MHIRLHSSQRELIIKNVKTVEYSPWDDSVEFYLVGSDDPQLIEYRTDTRVFKYQGSEYEFCRASTMNEVVS